MFTFPRMCCGALNWPLLSLLIYKKSELISLTCHFFFFFPLEDGTDITVTENRRLNEKQTVKKKTGCVEKELHISPLITLRPP